MKIKILVSIIIIALLSWISFNFVNQDNSALIKLINYNKKITEYDKNSMDILTSYEETFENISQEDYQNAKKSSNAKVKFCIVAPSFNNENTKSIKSVFMQNYHNWKMVYATNELIAKKLIEPIKNKLADNNKLLLHVQSEVPDTAIFYEQANSFCHDDEVMVFLDSSTILADSNVLSKLANIYENDKVWITYGSWIGAPRGFVTTNQIANLDNVREYIGIIGSLRTAYTWLFKKIDPQDLKINGQFFNAAGDLSWLYPMLEMAGKNRIKFINDITAIYHYRGNYDYPIYYLKEKIENEKYIRNKKKYKLLEIQ